MGLDKLIFTYPEFTLEIGTNLIQNEGAHPALFCIDAIMKFPSGIERKGQLVYDNSAKRFYSALSDLWETPIDWNDPQVDFSLVRKLDRYRCEVGDLVTTLLDCKFMTIKKH